MLDSKFWKKYFEVYDVLNMVIPYQELMGKVIDTADVQKGDLVLDVGSGTGNLFPYLKVRGGKVIGIDFSKEGLDRSKGKYPEIDVIAHDITKRLPFPDNYFDKIVSNNVIYAIVLENRDSLIQELKRVLKPGGKVVISNIRKGWKPSKIYADHLKSALRKNGFPKLFFKVFEMSVPTVKIFYYNSKIKQEEKGEYGFMAPGEQKLLLEKNGFIDVSDDLLIYAGQAILNSAFKPR